MIDADDVGKAIGRSLTAPEVQQVNLWIGWTRKMISNRLGDLNGLDQDDLDMVTTEVVVARLRAPADGRTSTEVAIDEGRVVDRFERPLSGLVISDEWWQILGWRPGGAFTITPSSHPGSAW
ncbi:hypothetical protein [Auraticoccus monumenti]|uniref:Uncharacterized protein n=1 Tax=Auraticoccus monumenti TaxID=675864 RepID=A0A1G6UKL8_9ACTN|nr:hypothetical protein [Auraticoccus monumenti]SDD41137.1 hypothetical protein SAMN04489747_0894 [Auraticoccus monumenti]